jgi:hypothetical protein
LFDHITLRKNTLVSITADAAPSRSRILKGLLPKASAVTDDKGNVFEYAATDEKENDHYWSRAHLPGAELSKVSSRSRSARDNKDADRSPDFNGWILPVFQTGYIKKFLKKDKEDLAKSS